MRLEMFLVALGMILLAAFGYRRRTIESTRTRTETAFTAASITTVEAAFLRAGRTGILELQAASEQCGARLADVDVGALEADLATRGLSFAAGTRCKMRSARRTSYALAAAAALATAIHDAASGAWPLAAVIEFAILWAGATLAIMTVTHLGSSTKSGREALAMRRAAYPVGLLRQADPAATVAHYGGTVRRHSESGDGGDGGYVWSADAGSSGHSSHGCASSCGSGGCGGH